MVLVDNYLLQLKTSTVSLLMVIILIFLFNKKCIININIIAVFDVIEPLIIILHNALNYLSYDVITTNI